MPKWLVCGVNGWHKWLVLCISTLAIACSPDRLTPGEEYLLRLTDALDTTKTRVAVSSPVDFPLTFPLRRDLLRDIPRQDISVVEFANLHRCDMGGLIGARNSGLGRLAGDMERLRYELAWIVAAEKCVASGQAWLAGHLAVKRSHLPGVVWNATVASTEFKTAMGATVDVKSVDANALQSIADLTAQMLVQNRADPDRLDTVVTELAMHLKNLSTQISVGKRLQAWHQIIEVLESATLALASREGMICRSGQPTPRMRRLVRVFQVYYLSRWQADFAQRLSQDRVWIQALHRLARLHADVATPAFAAWLEASVDTKVGGARESVWQRLQSAIQSHVQAWQHLLKGCGMQVTDLRVEQ